MTLSPSPITLRSWGLILLTAGVVVFSGAFSSFDEARAANDPAGSEEKRMIEAGDGFDPGSNSNSVQSPRQDTGQQALATPTPGSEILSQASAEDDPSRFLEARSSGDTGDIIRQRVFTTLTAAVSITACLLLLVWGYITLRDPLRRHRSAMRIRHLRREERRSRHRRR